MRLKNPLETAFNMGDDAMEVDDRYDMTTLPNTAVAPTEAPADVKDSDDELIEGRIDQVYDAAMQAFETQTSYTEVIEPRYAARNAEVAANYLNIALAAANSRAKVKNDRKRSNAQFVPYGQPGGKTTNNLIVASREDVLRMINVDGKDKELK